MMPKQRCAIILSVLMGLLLVWGHALGSGKENRGEATTDPDPAQVLKVRASEYWQHKIKRNFEKTYQYESPERIKKLSLTDYIGTYGAGVQWLGAEVEKVTIQDKTGLVLMNIRYLWTFAGDQSRKDVPDKGLTNKYLDRWELVDGTWYHQFKTPKLPKPPSKEKTTSDGPATEGSTDIKKEADENVGKTVTTAVPETEGSPEPKKQTDEKPRPKERN